MANTTLSPNMGMPVPTVNVDPGPDWATNYDASLSIIDSHNHSNGSGVLINPAGININSDLPFGSKNATLLRSTRYSPQGSPLALGTDVGCVYVSGVDLWFNDVSGTPIRLTQSGSAVGSPGTITGLPSGTASASYAAGTFTFQSATNTAAAMSFGPVTITQQVISGFGVTISASASQAANYNLTLPVSLPGSGVTQFMSLNDLGQISVIGYIEGTWSPTITNISGVSSSTPGTGYYQQIGNVVYGSVFIDLILSSSSSQGQIRITLPIAPPNNFSTNNQATGITGVSTSTYTSGIGHATPGAKTMFFNIFGNGTSTTASQVLCKFSYILNT